MADVKVVNRLIVIKCCGDTFKTQYKINKKLAIKNGTIIMLKIGEFLLKTSVRNLLVNNCLWEAIYVNSDDKALWSLLLKNAGGRYNE